ncbi:MAG: PadR family transcriptional regulator [Cyclobacteriaceae bacterium]
MGKYQIGEFEEIVMLTVAILHGTAYGVSIRQEIESTLSRKVSVGALQSCLSRLEKKGFLSSKDGEVTSERGGRPKRYFEITASGKQVLEDTKNIRMNLWQNIPQAVLDLKFSRC